MASSTRHRPTPIITVSVKAARTQGLTVSCDLNYRKNLWKWGAPAKDVMTELFGYVDVGIANEEDCQLALGIEAAVENAIKRAGKTLRNLRWFEVVETRGHLENGAVAHWQVTIKVGFTLEE